MRPNDKAKPPGVQARRSATSKIRGEDQRGAEREREHAVSNARKRQSLRIDQVKTRGEDQQPRSTAKVALWVAAETAISANRAKRSPALRCPARSSRR